MYVTFSGEEKKDGSLRLFPNISRIILNRLLNSNPAPAFTVMAGFKLKKKVF